MEADVSVYRYADPALHADPYHYMYTPFEGPGFLRAYLDHRKELGSGCTENCIDTLIDVLLVLVPDPAQKGTGPQVYLIERDEDVPPTRSLLLGLAAAAARRRDPAAWRPWVDALVPRFEVRKRLHAQYDAQVRPIGPEAGTDELALFAALLLLAYDSDANVKLLNTAIKVVDLIAARQTHEATAAALLPALADAEAAAVREIMWRHGVVP